jgi:hypothetical protein
MAGQVAMKEHLGIKMPWTGSYRRGVHLENTPHDKNRRQNPRR